MIDAAAGIVIAMSVVYIALLAAFALALANAFIKDWRQRK